MKKILFLTFITILLFLAGCSTNTELTFDEAKAKVENHFQNDESIAEFKIVKFEFSHENNKGEKVYSLQYSMKPTYPDNYVLAGNGKIGEKGWIDNRYYFVTFTKNQDIFFSTSP